MKPGQMSRQIYAFVLAFLLISTQIIEARPFEQNPFLQDGDKVKKLPPIHYVRSRDFDMRHIALNLRFDWEKEQTYGTAQLTLAPLVPDFQKVKLDAGLMRINSVKLNGKDLTFNYDEAKSNLTVNLDRIYKIGEPVTFTVDYRTNGKVVPNTLGFGGGGGLKFIKPSADNPNGRKQIWTQGETDYNRFWFPSYDSPNDFRTSEITATVEKPMFVMSNGKLVSRNDNGDGTETFHWKMDTPFANYLTSVVVGEYAEVKGEYQGIPVSTFLYPNELKEGASSVKKLPEMVKFFSEITRVKYPYVKYAQTMAEGFGGGMENITATTMTPDMIHDERELLDTDSESLQSHELAHQWFGDFVTTREWSDIWLNESFATYFQALWHEHSKGHDFFLYSDIRNNQQAYFNTWNQGSRRPIVTKYYTNADALFDTYAYPRGGAVLHMLRKHLGDELFFKAINHYLVSNANQPVQTEELRIAIEEATGQSMDWFFDQWLYKMGHPVFEVTQDYDEAKKQLTLSVKQTQKIDPLNEYPQVEFFQTFVDIEIDNLIERVWIEPKAENFFTFNVAQKPKLIDFDNEGTLIKELKFEKPTDDLVYQFKNDKDVLGRASAMRQLSSRWRAKETADADKTKILAAFNQTMTNDPFWAIRRDAVQIVTAPQGDSNNPAPANYDQTTISALVTAAKDKSSLVRAAAITGLGRLRDTKYADLFLAALNDPSYGVIDSASIALVRIQSPKAFDALTKLVNTPSWRNRIESIGLIGLELLGDKRAFDTFYKIATDQTQPPSLRTTALGGIGATGKGDQRAFPLIFEQFKKALDKRDFRALDNAVRGIIKLADPRGQQAFDMMKEKFKGEPNILNFVNQFEGEFKAELNK